MKKLLLVLALLGMVAPAFALPDVSMYLDDVDASPSAPGVLEYATPVPGHVTLYLWAQYNAPDGDGIKDADQSLVGYGINFDFAGDVTDPQFTFTRYSYGGIPPSYSWDTNTAGTSFPATISGASLDNTFSAAAGSFGLYAGVADKWLMGTLEFDSATGNWEVLGKPALIGDFFALNKISGNLEETQPGDIVVSWGDVTALTTGERDNGDVLPGNTMASAAPEPTTMILLGLGVLGVLRRRR